MGNLVDYTFEDGIARITLDDGKLNVMSLEMLQSIDAALDRAEANGAAVVLRSGRPQMFSAGFDLKVFARGDIEGSYAMVHAGAELALRLMAFPRPVIGGLNGHAFPMGTFLLLASDIRIAADGPHRMGLNEVAIGIATPSFAIELARSRVHPAWLSRTVTTGEMFTPDDALTAGFIDLIVAPEELEASLMQTAAALRDLHADSHRTAKRRLRAAAMETIRQAIDAEITLDAYQSRMTGPSTVVLPGAA